MVEREYTEAEMTKIIRSINESVKRAAKWPTLEEEIAEIRAHHARLAKIREDMWKEIESFYGPLDPPALQKKA